VCETLLTRIEINCGNALSCLQERDRNMERGGGFSRATFLVAEHNDMCGLTSFLDWLDQHAAPSGCQFSKYWHALVKLNRI
jgi:hypothetical protein